MSCGGAVSEMNFHFLTLGSSRKNKNSQFILLVDTTVISLCALCCSCEVRKEEDAAEGGLNA